MNPVLHRCAQPVSTLEFLDALRAATPPRFPHGHSTGHKKVGLAISGGVDSMAMAYLCSQVRRVDPWARVADAPVGSFYGIVVDHGLREGSDAEAAAVVTALGKLDIRARAWRLKWPGRDAPGVSGMSDSGSGLDSGLGSGLGPGFPLGPSPPSRSIETLARRLRYRMLGQRMAQFNIVSLLLAHHEDDQYETVLMRLLSGYGLNGGIRGLRGMRAAGDIPECNGLYNVHQSGFGDDQRCAQPYVRLLPSRAARRRMKRALWEDDEKDAVRNVDRVAGNSSFRGALSAIAADAPDSVVPDLGLLETEDLGIYVYRPLLAFSKDRLVATCQAHNVPWFEDHTNSDPRLTLRNALRHLARNYTLPEALQKPAILRLAAHCNAMASQDEAEARRCVVRQRMIVRFTPNTGVVVVQLGRASKTGEGRAKKEAPRERKTRRAKKEAPRERKTRRAKETTPRRNRPRPFFSPRTSPSYAAASHERRLSHLRTVAALVVQSLLGLVSPEKHLTPVSQLHAVVDTLFPDLRRTTAAAPAPAPAKAFIICGVHFVPEAPAEGRWQSRWYLARAPYASTTGVSRLRLPPRPLMHRWNKPASAWPWPEWSPWHLYDGRFWIRIRNRLPAAVLLMPFAPEHAKAFREGLGLAVSKASSPWSGGDETTDKRLPPTPLQAHPEAGAALSDLLRKHAPGKVRFTLPALYATADVDWALQGQPYWPPNLTRAAGESEPETAARRHRCFLWEREVRQAAAQSSTPYRLVALPSLGVHLPGIEQWLQWEVRYRKVDRVLVESSEE